MGEEFDADRIGRRDVCVVADLTGGGGVDIDIKMEVFNLILRLRK